MSLRRLIRINGFPLGVWQVIWFGEIAYDSSQGLYSQPNITFVLQAVDKLPIQRKRVSAGVGRISMVPLGSVWEDGVRVVERPAGDMVLRRVDVFPNRVEETRAGGPLNASPGSPHLLPFGAFDFHDKDTKTPCLRWTTSSMEVFVLPTIEAIRFYFGTSSYLLQRIITGNPSFDAMWEWKSLDPVTGNAHIHLAPDVPQQKSPAQIARIAFDPVARREAERVHRSLSIASGSRSPVQPRMMFPFTKPATLRVAGIPVVVEGEPPRFVIMRIDSCTGPYPFNNLEVTGGKDVKEAYEGNTPEDDGTDARERKTVSIGSGEPNSGRVGRSEAQWEGHRFVDLIRKKVSFTHERTNPGGDDSGGRPANDGAYALGDGAASGEGAALELRMEARPIFLAFIDHRLIGGDHASERWKALADELAQGCPQILAILIASAQPDWADDLPEATRCIVDIEGALSHEAKAIVSEAISAWASIHKDSARPWQLFTAESPVTDPVPQWAAVGLESDVLEVVRAAFRAPPFAR